MAAKPETLDPELGKRVGSLVARESAPPALATSALPASPTGAALAVPAWKSPRLWLIGGAALLALALVFSRPGPALSDPDSEEDEDDDEGEEAEDAGSEDPEEPDETPDAPETDRAADDGEKSPELKSELPHLVKPKRARASGRKPVQIHD